MNRIWLWFIAALLIVALILTCNARYARENAEQKAKQQDTQDKQMQAAIDMLRGFPTAAGKKK